MRVAAALALLLTTSASLAEPPTVLGVRMWEAPDNTRIVFDLSAPVDYQLFTLKNPDRIVVDIHNAVLTPSATLPAPKSRVLQAVRSGRRGEVDARIVLDLSHSSRPKSFLLRPNAEYGHRLVIDLYPEDGAGEVVPKTIVESGPRDIVVAIDAGHGGEDPGARGHDGTLEKDVVLGIARKLSALVEAETGMRPVMIRSGDYYLSLRQRIDKARAHKADLFVSIHADSYKSARVGGASVYVLSRNGASDEAARLLAEKENASDLIGGVSLDDKDDLLASVLLDLSQTATHEASAAVATTTLHELKRVVKLHKSTVAHAGFAVLKSPDVPSILVETAFISNPDEERRLRNERHQQVLAQALMNGVRGYFALYPPPGAVRVARQHVIEPGETLSGIAQRYHVRVMKLREANSLSDDLLQIGQRLTIPAAGGT